MGDKIRFSNNDTDFGETYEPTDSEDEYSEEEKELLAKVRKGRRRTEEGNKELMAFSESDDDDDDDDEDGDLDELVRDSDIEGAEDDDDLPDDKEWGKSNRNYYNTDFVDPDYSSYNAEEEELAKAEEEEAKKIQLRLVKHMTDADFGLDKIVLDNEKHKSTEKGQNEETIKFKTDLSRMTQQQRLQLLHQESPEFSALIKNFTDFLNTVKSLIGPVTLYAREKKVPDIPALQFSRLYENILMTYCSNIAFYLLLKAKRIDIKRHPVIKRIVQLKDLLDQLKDKYENIIEPQLDALLERIENGDSFEIKAPEEKPKVKKGKLQIMDEYENATKKQRLDKNGLQTAQNGLSTDDESGNEDNEDDDNADAEEGEVDARRGITYQIAKNKGLTPHRKKELRNPRVKHRGKYRKALIRRKGAVRTVRKELQRYGGEISGIKATVSKSIKFKT